MSKDKLTDYDSTTASNNTDIGGISVAEGMLPSAVNNSIRELTKQLGAFADGTDGIDVLSLADDDASHAIKLQAPSAVTADTTFTLPDGDGTDGQAILTDGAGTLSWGAVGDNLTGIQTFTSSGTYTPTAGTAKVLVYVVGGGGAGGGADGNGGDTGTASGGGGGGATSIKFISTGLGETETVTVGAGGVGNSTTTGGAGGTTSFGSHATATGGLGGGGGTGGGTGVNNTLKAKEGGAGGSITSGVGDVLISGQAGGNGISGAETSGNSLVSGEGGSSHFGGGAKGKDGLENGIDAVGYGGGGGGASSFNTTGNRTGGAGADGVVVIYEYE